jgi:hypothetical protein
MNLLRREGFVTAQRQGILWYSTEQHQDSPEAGCLQVGLDAPGRT